MIELGKRYKFNSDKMSLDGLAVKGSEFTATSREVGDHWLNEWTRTGDVACVEQEVAKKEEAPAPKESAPEEVAETKEEATEEVAGPKEEVAEEKPEKIAEYKKGKRRG